MKFGDFVGRKIEWLFSPIPKYLFTKAYRTKYYKRLPKERKKREFFFHNIENGYYITLADSVFGNFYSGYPAFLSFLIIGIADKKWGSLNDVIVVLLFAIPIFLCYTHAYNAVYYKNRYLKYFRQFEKEDEAWHRKWKRITIAFCIGSIISTLLGIVIGFSGILSDLLMI